MSEVGDVEGLPVVRYRVMIEASQIALNATLIFLSLGAVLRLTRLVVTDEIGYWLIRRPAYNWASFEPGYDDEDEPIGWKHKLVSGLDCPFCVGYWIAFGVIASLLLIRPTVTESVWTIDTLWFLITASLTANWLAAHIGSRLGDAGYDHD